MCTKAIFLNVPVSTRCPKCGRPPSETNIVEYCAYNYPGKIPNACKKCDSVFCDYRVTLEEPGSLLAIFEFSNNNRDRLNKFISIHQCNNCKTVYRFKISKDAAMKFQASLQENIGQ